MVKLVPRYTGPVLNRFWYGFMDETAPKKKEPEKWEMKALMQATEAFLKKCFDEKLKKGISSIKAVHVNWEHYPDGVPRFDDKSSYLETLPAFQPYIQLSFVLHVKDQYGDWVLQNDIMDAMVGLPYQDYIKEYVWKVKDPKSKKEESVFKHAVNNIFLSCAHNLKIPRGLLPEGVCMSHLDDEEPPLKPEKPAKKEEPKKKTFDDIYELKEELGKGAFAVVRSAHKKDTKDVYAVKTITKAEMQEFDMIGLQSEISVLQKDLPPHKNIIRLYDVFDETDYVHLVLEKVDGGEVFDRLVKKKNYTEREARDLMKIVMDAVQHIHKHKIAHRDLKPANLLLTSPTDDSSVKIADFGFAKVCPDDDSLTTKLGSAQHVAPEILLSKPYGTKVDMWALGVIAFVLIGGYFPFYSEIDNQDTFKKIIKGDYSLNEEYWGHVSKDCKDMIQNLLVQSPSERWSAGQCLASKWMKNDADELGTSLHKNQQKLEQTSQKVKDGENDVLAMNQLKSITE